ncbi:MAG: glycosyltransferase family 2 protein [Metallosphaera yellowstonensis]|jgi:Glycosyltransferases, probably involved in cell wall biogenesis
MNLLAELMLQLAIFGVPSFLLIYQYIFFRAGVSLKEDLQLSVGELPKVSIIVPTKGERIENIQGLLDNINEVEWDKSKLEVIIVSDDSSSYYEEMLNHLKVPRDLKVKILRREKPIGYKSGALREGFEYSDGDLILTLDVDARLQKDSLLKAFRHMLKFGCDAVTMNWVGYTGNRYSTLAKALMVSTIIADISLLKGRDSKKMRIFPVGCGTMFKRTAIEEVGPWDPSMIQDDLEIGARLIHKGKRICASSSSVFVEVPDNLVSFYIQQTRWAMGSIEVLVHRRKEIFSKNLSLREKLDIIVFLLQYVPIALTFLAALVLVPLALFGVDVLRTPLLVLWFGALGIYGFNFIKTAKKTGLNLLESMRALGKISSYTVAISPFILLGLISGLRKERKYIVTPKGKKVTTRIQYPISAFGVLFLMTSIIYLLHASWVTGLWLLYYSIGYVFTVLTFKREL